MEHKQEIERTLQTIVEFQFDEERHTDFLSLKASISILQHLANIIFENLDEAISLQITRQISSSSETLVVMLASIQNYDPNRIQETLQYGHILQFTQSFSQELSMFYANCGIWPLSKLLFNQPHNLSEISQNIKKISQNIKKISQNVRKSNEDVKKTENARKQSDNILQKITNLNTEIREEVSELRNDIDAVGVAVYVKQYDDEIKNYEASGKMWLGLAIGLGVATIIIIGVYNPVTNLKEDAPLVQTISAIFSKVMVVSLLFGSAVWCAKLFRTNQHLATVNKFKMNGLKTFKGFMQSASDQMTKDAVLLATTHAIFSDQSTGFLDNKDGSPSNSKVFEILDKRSSTLPDISDKT